MTKNKTREKIVGDYARGKGASEIARLYGVSRKTVYNLVELQQNSGSLQARMETVGRKPALTTKGLEEMKSLILAQPDITLEEIKEEMQLDICVSAIHRIIKGKLGFTYKKNSTRH
jgi:transposase